MATRLPSFGLLFALGAACSSPTTTATSDADATADGVVQGDSLTSPTDAATTTDSAARTDSGTAPDVAPLADASVNDYITAACSLIQRCITYDFNLTYTSVADCVSVIEAPTNSVVLAPGYTQAEITAMTNAMNNGACYPLFAGSYTLSTYGTLANGAGCFQNAQCQSGSCQKSTTTFPGFLGDCSGNCDQCGVCGGVGEGASCSQNTDCIANFACIGGTCKTRLATGGACSSNDQCQTGYCYIASDAGDAGANAMTGQCMDIVFDVPAGSTTSPGHGCQAGLNSISTLGSTDVTCETAVIIAVGGSCADAGSGVCQGGYCDPATDLCTAKFANGAACDLSSNDHCRNVCVPTVDGGTAGTCQTAPNPTCP